MPPRVGVDNSHTSGLECMDISPDRFSEEFVIFDADQASCSVVSLKLVIAV